MKRYSFGFIIFILSFCTGCERRLQVMNVSNGDIEVTKYVISEITTSRLFIEVSKGDSVCTILEADEYGFADISIVQDTVIVQYLPTVIYGLRNTVFDYKIVLDTSISIDYWRQKVEEKENDKN